MSFDKQQLVTAVIKGISDGRKKPLSSDEIIFVNNRINTVKIDDFRGQKITAILSALIKVISHDLIKRPSKLDDQVDIHDVFVREIGMESDSALSTKKVDESATVDSLLQQPSTLQRIFNPAALHRKAYLILDRRYQSKDANNVTEFKWNITNTSKHYNPLTYAITTAPLQDVTKIKLFPFRFPNTTNLLTSRNRLAVEILEFNTQGYVITQSQRKVHFILDITPVSGTSQYNATEVCDSVAEFEFHDPIVSFETMTLRFSNPETILSLDADSLSATISPSGAKTLLTFTTPHNTIGTDILIISGFTTSLPVDDAAQIAALNNTNGLAIDTVVNPLLILVNVNISTLAGVISNPVTVYFDTKRFSLRLELTYIAKKNDV